MSKNVLIISTSPRKGSNSDLLADEFLRGAQEAGHKVEKITFVQKMLVADVIVFATPIYYYEMCGQMKTMLDRSNPLYGSDYRFQDIYLLTAAAEEDDSTMDGAINGLQGWIACFERAHLAGMVFGGGVGAAGEIKGHPALQKAYEMGKAIG